MYTEGTERTWWKTPRLAYTVRKGYRFSCPQPGFHQPNSLWPGVIEIFLARESILAGDVETITFFTVQRRKPASGGTTSGSRYILLDPTWVSGRKSTNIPYPSKSKYVSRYHRQIPGQQATVKFCGPCIYSANVCLWQIQLLGSYK